MSYANNQLNDQRYMYDWIVKNDCKKKKEHVYLLYVHFTHVTI